MPTHSTESTGFAVPMQASLARRHDNLPALIAMLALGLSIAVVLTVAMNTARAAQLF
jgi:hypothetical protein